MYDYVIIAKLSQFIYLFSLLTQHVSAIYGNLQVYYECMLQIVLILLPHNRQSTNYICISIEI
jgi:hypothetical protein